MGSASIFGRLGRRRIVTRLVAAGLGWLALNGSSWATIPPALDAALQSDTCRQNQPFYWEIGDRQGRRYGGSQGRNAPAATTVMPIASATKWLFAAYVVQRRNGQLTPADIEALTMRSGYTHLKYSRCVRLLPSRRQSQTVEECFTTRGNDGFTAQHQQKNFYNGGHFQALAVHAYGMKAFNSAMLGAEITRGLGLPMQVSFNIPLLAGGAAVSAADYAEFLRALLDGRLLLGAQLGTHAVCTQPSACASAAFTPVPPALQWQYSLGHWVESDPHQGDGAFSSAGAFGFYPWIDASKRFYGLIARDEKGREGAHSSAACGRLLRQAFLGEQGATMR